MRWSVVALTLLLPSLSATMIGGQDVPPAPNPSGSERSSSDPAADTLRSLESAPALRAPEGATEKSAGEFWRVTSVSSLPADLFPVPASLEPAVRFWRDVFGRYESSQIVVHDDRYLDVVFEVVDTRDLAVSGQSAVAKEHERERRVRRALESHRRTLRYLAGDHRLGVTEEEQQRVLTLYEQVPGGRERFREAVDRVRGQAGLRDRFAEAIVVAGMFMPGIERELLAREIPLELARLPFVESMFNYRARSKVGASGAWQFTRSTGQLFLHINSALDERHDVLLAAAGAADMLKRGHTLLGSWPLVLTGYNHGLSGVLSATRRLGTKDIGEIVEKYRSPSFGFASRNFYAEFVAAASIYGERENYFPGVQLAPELRFEEFQADRYVSLLDLADLSGIETRTLADLNPALLPAVISGDLLIPPQYRLRVPVGQRSAMLSAYDRAPSFRKLSRQIAERHIVRSGETISAIARRYGVSMDSIRNANRVSRDRIYVGQVLEIPGAGQRGWQKRLPDEESPPANLRVAASETERPRAEDGHAGGDGSAGPAAYHVVGRGDTLAAIASKYKQSVTSLAAVNGLTPPYLLRIGEQIKLTSGGATVVKHQVKRGDTLFSVARSYRTTVTALMQTNRLASSTIVVGQVLLIPAS